MNDEVKMPNSDYWRNRFSLIEDDTYKRVNLTKDEIYTLNKNLSRKMEKDILYWTSKFAKNNELTMIEARELLSDDDFEDFKHTLEEYIQHGSSNYINEDWKRILENMSDRYHISRVQALETILRQYSEMFVSMAYKEIENTLLDVYKLNYYTSYYEIGKGVGVKLSFQGIDKNKLDMLLKKPWTPDGIEFSERIWKDKRAELVNSLWSKLTECTIRGENPRTMSSSLAKEFDVKKHMADNILHTESAHIAEVARNKCFENLGVKKYIIVATLDIKTSNICRRMDGKVFESKYKKIGENAPPFHCYCRTTTAPHIEELDELDERAARDKNGKIMYVPAEMTYDKWYEKYVEGDEEYKLKEKKYKNRHSDKKQFTNYKKAGVNIPRSFDKFQDLKYNSSERDNKLRSIDYTRRMKLKGNPSLKLPNVENATIDKNKFEKYLFGGDYKHGLIKGELIEKRLGYNISNYKDFEKEILKNAKVNPAINKGSNGYITKYEQKIIMYNANGIPSNLKIGWAVNESKTHLTTIFIDEVK